MKIRAVLFDLDGTLLELDLDRFLRRYFEALERVTAPLLTGDGQRPGALEALHGATRRMMGPPDGRTNRQVFFGEFLALTGVDLNAHEDVYDRFYRDVFPSLADTASPARGARDVVESALALGMRVAIATNPIFPRAAIDHRIAWAGLADLPFDVVTSYETMHACKPHAAYFLETARLLGMEARECLMVGDDAELDMPAADTGMLTHYVGTGLHVAASSRGDLKALAGSLRELAATRAPRT